MADPPSPKPEAGTLATSSDLEQIMSLDQWLAATDPAKLGIVDAWNAGSTLSAFAFNGTIGVNKAHASNVWVDSWDEGDDHISSPDLDQDDHGLYVYISDGPYLIENLVPASTVATTPVDTPFANGTPSQDNFTWEYSLQQGVSTSLSVTQSSDLTIEGSFTLGPFSFDVKDSMDNSKTTNNQQSTVATTTMTVNMPVPANSTYVFRVTTYTTSQEDSFGIDFSLGASSLADPPGGIAKATADRGTWDQFYTIDQLVPDDGSTQTAQWNVTSTTVVTKIQTGVQDAGGNVNWGPEKKVTPADPTGDGDGGDGGDGGNGGDGGGDGNGNDKKGR